MNIILDGLGGDNVPLETLRGAAAAVKSYGISMTVTGDVSAMHDCAVCHNIPLDSIELVEAPRIIPMDLDPTRILKDYADSSMAVGLRLLSEGQGDAFVSAGSTGALLMGATFVAKRLKGVRRPAIGTMIPGLDGKPYLLIDAGANHDCRPEMLRQFGIMGSIYFGSLMGVAAPRVGLVNIGTEAHKGDELRRGAYELLSSSKEIHFIGNIEARELPNGGCDVAVCDGFTGNIILKLSEGFGTFFSHTLKEMLTANTNAKLGAMMLKGEISHFKNMLDYTEHGGAPLLGVRKPVIKAHGASNGQAFQNAVRQAIACCEQDVAGQIERGLAALGDEKEENA